MKKLLMIILALCLVFSFAACSQQTTEPDPVVDPEPVVDQPVDTPDPVTILVAAAASLENAYVQELIPLFQEKHDWITVEGSYDSSGKLQTQIEEGLAADVFMSAAMKQMNALVEGGFIDETAVVKLLENKIVLIEPAAGGSGPTSFEEVLNAPVIAIGDPQSVPAGQYAAEIFTSLGIIDDVLAKATLGTNVTEVLSWVGEGSADVGVVYATDAASTDKVSIICEAPQGSLATPVIYPVAMVKNSANAEAAQLFVDFLRSAEAMAIFESFGFTSNL